MIENSKSSSGAYAQAGVDIDRGEALVERIKPFAKSTARAGSTGGLGGFGALFDLKAAGFVDPILVASNDGVGTKVKIAIETGSHATIGVDLVAMCANDIVVQGAQPLFFLDYFASGSLNVDVATQVVEGIAVGCRQAGAALVGGETAEMPGLYQDGDYDLAGFCVGAAERGTLLPLETVMPGDILIGIASSGLHSNGFSLVRKIVNDAALGWATPAPFDASRALGTALLDPTRIYVRAAMAAHATGCVKAFAHITGGGLPGNVPRVLPAGVVAHIDLGALRAQPVFRWLAQQGKIPASEMLRTFNCGIGFVAVAAAEHVERVISAFSASGEKAAIIGDIRRGDDGAPASVSFSGDLDLEA